MHSDWRGETEAGSWKLLGTASRQEWLCLAELCAKEAKEDLDSPGLVSTQRLALESSLLHWHHVVML